MTPSRIIVAGAAALAVGAGITAVVLHTDLLGPSAEEQWTMVETYCVECHNAAEAAGGLVFEGMGPDSVPLEPQVFEAAVRKLRGRLMPPPGGPAARAAARRFVRRLARTDDRRATRCCRTRGTCRSSV